MTTGADLDEDKLAEAEKKANEILERAKNGEDFDALIKEYMRPGHGIKSRRILLYRR